MLCEPRSLSEKASDGDVSSGEEQVVFGDARREVRMEVAGGRFTDCFLKSPSSGHVMFVVSLTVISQGMQLESLL